jgi:hypothetical protein
MSVANRPSEQDFRGVASSAYEAIQGFCNKHGIPCNIWSPGLVEKIEGATGQFERHAKVLDATKNTSYLSDNRDYLFRSSAGELVSDHATRMKHIQREMTSTLNRLNQGAKTQAAQILGHARLDGDEVAKQEFRGLMAEVSKNQQQFMSEEFKDWADAEQHDLMQKHCKNPSRLVFRPADASDQVASLMAVDIKGVDKIKVDIQGSAFEKTRKNFAEISLDKEGKPNTLSFNVYYYEHGDNDYGVPMYFLPWRKSNSNTSYNTFSHSPWRSFWRDQQGRQKLGGLDNQPDFMVDLYEETFSGAENLQQKEVDILNADARVIMACAKAFIKRGYKVSEKTYKALEGNQLQGSSSNNGYAAELRHFEDSEGKSRTAMRDTYASKHRIEGVDGVMLTPDQERVDDIVEEAEAAPTAPTV